MKELVPKDKEKKKPKEDQWSVFDFKQLEYFREKTEEMLEKRFWSSKS